MLTGNEISGIIGHDLSYGTVKVEDEEYFILNEEEESRPAAAFSATTVRLSPKTLDDNGIYSGVVFFLPWCKSHGKNFIGNLRIFTQTPRVQRKCVF